MPHARVDDIGDAPNITNSPPAAFTAYQNSGGTLTLERWRAAGQPTAPIAAEQPSTSVTPGATTDGTVTTPVTPPPPPVTPPPAPPPVIPPPPPPPPPSVITDPSTITTDDGTITLPGTIQSPTPGPITQNADGFWVHDLNGSIWTNQADAIADYNSTLQSQGFQETLRGDVERFQADIGRLGSEQAAEARRGSARRTGELTREVRNALLNQGFSGADIEQLTAGGIEGANRSLNDVLIQLDLSTQQQLAGASQFGINTSLTAEGLAQSQRQIAGQTSQFGQSLAEQVRQFNQAQGQQASQFGQQFGLSQQQFGLSEQQLRAQIDQFNQQFGQQQRREGFFGSQGFLANALGSVSFGIGG